MGQVPDLARKGKASIEEIRHRFDNDVERFANLATGQMSTQDAALVMESIAASAVRATPGARSLLDLGCGAGNFSLRMAQVFELERIVLVDLSSPMLERAISRLGSATQATVCAHQADIREAPWQSEQFDVVVAAAVLHHLRGEDEWDRVLRSVAEALRPGGSLWIWDLIDHEIGGVRQAMWEQYGEYLEALRGPDYRAHVFDYIAHEDSPRSVVFLFDALRRAGFSSADVVHKSGCFAAIAALK